MNFFSAISHVLINYKIELKCNPGAGKASLRSNYYQYWEERKAIRKMDSTNRMEVAVWADCAKGNLFPCEGRRQI